MRLFCFQYDGFTVDVVADSNAIDLEVTTTGSFGQQLSKYRSKLVGVIDVMELELNAARS